MFIDRYLENKMLDILQTFSGYIKASHGINGEGYKCAICFSEIFTYALLTFGISTLKKPNRLMHKY